MICLQLPMFPNLLGMLWKADDKKRARLNCISHLLETVPYEVLPLKDMELPPRQKAIDYERPPLSTQNFVEAVY